MKTDKKARSGMKYYLRKFWKANFLAILPVLAVCALQTGTSLVMIRIFQSVIERSLSGFSFWILMMVGAWLLLLGINSLQEFFQGRAVRAMNNAVRRDMAATLLQKTTWSFMRWTPENTCPCSPMTSIRSKIWHGSPSISVSILLLPSCSAPPRC